MDNCQISYRGMYLYLKTAQCEMFVEGKLVTAEESHKCGIFNILFVPQGFGNM